MLCPDWQPQLLSTPQEKEQLLRQLDIDRLEVLTFDQQLSQLSARQFMQQVLRDRLSVRLLLTGYDNRFGHQREEGFADYQRHGRELGIDVVAAEPYSHDGQRFSSSLVRQQLAEGDVKRAWQSLGRPYCLSGSVVHGNQIGRRLGFPTANLTVAPCKLIPREGVYAVMATVEGHDEPLPAMMNIGHRPTFDGHRLTLEAHLFHFDADLYGRQLTISFIERLRDECHFDSTTLLVSQMEHDRLQAEQILAPLSFHPSPESPHFTPPRPLHQDSL